MTLALSWQQAQVLVEGNPGLVLNDLVELHQELFPGTSTNVWNQLLVTLELWEQLLCKRKEVNNRRVVNSSKGLVIGVDFRDEETLATIAHCDIGRNLFLGQQGNVLEKLSQKSVLGQNGRHSLKG